MSEGFVTMSKGRKRERKKPTKKNPAPPVFSRIFSCHFYSQQLVIIGDRYHLNKNIRYGLQSVW